ncbi:MAG: UDP-N-acetylglucosamine 1-carboxyvinyltransferase [Thermoguttaceae bacterium]
MPLQRLPRQAVSPARSAGRCRLTICGGVRLEGAVAVAGAKNAALPIMAAAILADLPVRLRGVACLSDVDTLASVLRGLGVAVERDCDSITLTAVDRRPCRAGYRSLRQMRAGFCVLGPLLARRGRALVSLPGGCHIGPRPVDLHLKGLAALGAELRIERGYVVALAPQLRGATIDLAGPRGSTVTGTANVLSAAVLARGVTTITSAATEPEIVDLGRFLNRIGARIEGLGSSVLTIRGVDQLGGGDYRVIPDRIEAATLLMAGAITRGRVRVNGACAAHLECVLRELDAAGFQLDTDAQGITLRADGPPRPRPIVARPYPGIPTDIQAQWTALLALASGASRVVDTVFPQRFRHVAELRRLGADVSVDGPAALVRGVASLQGAPVHATDLRAGAALVLAGLAAGGKTVVTGLQHLDRGYDGLDRKLACLGAAIRRAPA